jgi:hypothetical protein
LGGVESNRKDHVRAELEIVTQAQAWSTVCSDHHGIDAATGQRMEHTVGGTSRTRIPWAGTVPNQIMQVDLRSDAADCPPYAPGPIRLSYATFPREVGCR